jgi:hypothetical protein
MSGREAARAKANRKYNQGSTVQPGDKAEASIGTAAATSSKLLLAAQIRTGQHSLFGETLRQRIVALRAEKLL